MTVLWACLGVEVGNAGELENIHSVAYSDKDGAFVAYQANLGWASDRIVATPTPATVGGRLVAFGYRLGEWTPTDRAGGLLLDFSNRRLIEAPERVVDRAVSSASRRVAVVTQKIVRDGLLSDDGTLTILGQPTRVPAQSNAGSTGRARTPEGA